MEAYRWSFRFESSLQLRSLILARLNNFCHFYINCVRKLFFNCCLWHKTFQLIDVFFKWAGPVFIISGRYEKVSGTLVCFFCFLIVSRMSCAGLDFHSNSLSILFRATTKGACLFFSNSIDSRVCGSRPCMMSTTRMARSHKEDPRVLRLVKDSWPVIRHFYLKYCVTAPKLP